jgi:hypothetical protein
MNKYPVNREIVPNSGKAMGALWKGIENIKA